MKNISESQYKKACERIEELLKMVDQDTPADDSKMKELVEVSQIVENYENEHFPIVSCRKV